jgi:hypothetical protein
MDGEKAAMVACDLVSLRKPIVAEARRTATPGRKCTRCFVASTGGISSLQCGNQTVDRDVSGERLQWTAAVLLKDQVLY